MDLLLFEWSFAGGPGSRSILPEGFGMLRSLNESFRQEGLEVTIPASEKLKDHSSFLKDADIVPVYDDPGKTLEEISPDFDCSFIIAPESHGILSRLTRSVSPDSRLLSCPTDTVETFADKDKAYQLVSQTCRHLEVPAYITTKTESKVILDAAQKIGFPCVIKPVDGAGSEGNFIVRSPSDVPSACAKLRSFRYPKALIQEYVRGRPLSATFHAGPGKTTLLAVNTQSISPSGSMTYMGGSCPFPLENSPALGEIEELSVRDGLRGILGLDFIDTGGGIYFMEINPRITTSCIGLSRIITPGLGSIIMGNQEAPELCGYAQWNLCPLQRSIRVEEKMVSRLIDMPNVVSPPFAAGQYYMKGSSKVLICVWGPDSLELPMINAGVKDSLAGIHLPC